MNLLIRFFANFKKYSPDQQTRSRIEAPPGATAADVLTELGLPEDLPKIILINGRPVNQSTQLNDGDEMTVFPPVEGG